MFKTVSLLALVALFAHESIADPIKCGAIPLNKVFECLGSPSLFHNSSEKKCPHTASECEISTCYAREYGWLSGDKLDKAKIIADFDAFAKTNPEWAAALEQTKADCINTELTAQGIHLNCPAYDVYLCTIGSLAKHASASQWSSKPECQTAKTYSTACPACPEDCFATQIPTGSCNACNALLRSP